MAEPGPVHVAAVDLGATSGRVVVAEVGPGGVRLDVVHRFANTPVRLTDGLHWDVVGLFREVVDGLRLAVRSTPDVAGVAVDSWAVDYALLRDGRMVSTPFHYRDSRNAAAVEAVHAAVDPAALYARNGLQHLPFNTVFQLVADGAHLEHADTMLLVPDLIGHWLTGYVGAEVTNASTTGLLDVTNASWDVELATTLGIPAEILAPLTPSGATLGGLLPHVAAELGGHDLAVTTVGSHDTASAIAGTVLGPDDAYVSCGTWGLAGLELERPVLADEARQAGFTNEGGVDGRVRFLHNVMGLWLLSESVRTWEREDGRAIDLPSLLAAAAEVEAPLVFDVDDPRFLPPGDIPARIRAYASEHGLRPPADRVETTRAILESLADAFATTLHRAAELAGRRIHRIQVVGGGALNTLLCQLTADRSGLEVLAGPVEATALGNALVQGRTLGAVSGDLDALRALVGRTLEQKHYRPRPLRSTNPLVARKVF
ncbi:rhamnulokinase [Mumia zhuanghuii]|uniref:Rhamnulokinase family protein n=2 Tax=Mumia TaxID=1546255 RepID=A0ABW1QGJ1_9ACTN|nr:MULTISPECIES: rhamnulokinase family protein [Mumia]KAA1424716.1 rhamnulokinase [Mumia zhuanghuii]